MTGLAQGSFPAQANGSMVYVNGKPIASSLDRPILDTAAVLPRPSLGDATICRERPRPTQADNSGGSNLGPTNQTLIKTVQQRIDDLKKENPDVPAGTPIPGRSGDVLWLRAGP